MRHDAFKEATSGSSRWGFRRADTIKPKRIEWLVDGFVPKGALQIHQGDPGEGKTSINLEWMARLSCGEAPIPGARRARPAASVFITGEDSAAHTLVHRLNAAGADMTKIHIRDCEAKQHVTLGNLEWLREIIEEVEPAVLVIDGLYGFFGDKDMYQDAKIRSILQPLATLATESNCAIICIRHNQKSKGQRAAAGGLGGIAVTGTARQVLAMGPIGGDESGDRFVTVAKSNLGPKSEALSYSVEPVLLETDIGKIETVRINWGERRPDVTADDLYREAPAGQNSLLSKASSFLMGLLFKPLSWVDVVSRGRKEGLSEATLRRARNGLAEAEPPEIVTLGGGKSTRWVRSDCLHPDDQIADSTSGNPSQGG